MVSLFFYFGLIFGTGIGIILISLCIFVSKAPDSAEFLGDGLSGALEVHRDYHPRLTDLPPAVMPNFKLGWRSSQARDPGGA